MPIEAHNNPELQGAVPARQTLAAGSSNSNSHNAGGGGGEPSPEEIRDVLNQLRQVLPRLQEMADKAQPPA
jgi:hypothetical protein